MGKEWLDEPTLFYSRDRPGRNRDTCRGRSRVGSGSPWMPWMPPRMGSHEDQGGGTTSRARESKTTYSANCEVTVRF